MGDLAHFAKGLEGRRIAAPAALAQRGFADLVEDAVVRHVIEIAHERGERAAPAPTRRSIEDVSVVSGGQKFYIDVKSREAGAQFSMPNLVSAKRLKKLYENDTNTLALIFATYERHGLDIVITRARILEIEQIAFESLAVQNLGHGQIQLRDGRQEPDIFVGGRAEWMAGLARMVIAFQDRLIEKTLQERSIWQEAMLRYGDTERNS